MERTLKITVSYSRFLHYYVVVFSHKASGSMICVSVSCTDVLGLGNIVYGCPRSVFHNASDVLDLGVGCPRSRTPVTIWMSNPNRNLASLAVKPRLYGREGIRMIGKVPSRRYWMHINTDTTRIGDRSMLRNIHNMHGDGREQDQTAMVSSLHDDVDASIYWCGVRISPPGGGHVLL